ncbi:LysR family transcriptional regulator [Acetobacter orientalis]|uniref:LysR family transcriptional regulator n=1 Tax=Acetobacter orientalis TaxID=146474 RepID=A0A2Z5ZLF6_9PROT|nr:LysR family transcriptional regulator [Acetobacter orientalis]
MLGGEELSERTLHYLDAVARFGSIRSAAAAIGVNASTISRQIAALEDQLRLALLMKSGRVTILTEMGEVVCNYGRERARLTRRFQTNLQEYRTLERGHVTIGSGEGIVTVLVKTVLHKFIASHPGITIEIRTAPLPQLVQMVRDDEVDVCIYAGTARDPILNARPFQTEPLCAILPIKHPLSTKSKVLIEEVVENPLIFFQPHFAAQTYVDAILDDRQLNFFPAFRCDMFGTALSLVAHNLGVAFMTKGAAQDYVAFNRVCAVPLDHPIACSFQRYAAVRAGRRLMPAAFDLWRDILSAGSCTT